MENTIEKVQIKSNFVFLFFMKLNSQISLEMSQNVQSLLFFSLLFYEREIKSAVHFLTFRDLEKIYAKIVINFGRIIIFLPRFDSFLLYLSGFR